MLSVFKRMRFWISAIRVTVRAWSRIRQIKNYGEFLLFLREREFSLKLIPTDSQWGQGISRIPSFWTLDGNPRTLLNRWSCAFKTAPHQKISSSKESGQHSLNQPKRFQYLLFHGSRSIDSLTNRDRGSKSWTPLMTNNLGHKRAEAKANHLESRVCRIQPNLIAGCRFLCVNIKP